MKHIKIFEDFSGVGGPGRYGLKPGMRGTVPEPNFGGASKYLIGYFATGGIGSHPGIATVDELEKLGWKNTGGESWYNQENDLFFDVTSESSQIPQALLCVFDMNRLRKIDPISRQEAQEIYNIGGTADYDERVLDQVEGLVDTNGFNDIQMISVIQNTKPNMVYWSDTPEEKHGYWESEGSRPMSLEDFTAQNYY